jgi:hypothetical protein
MYWEPQILYTKTDSEDGIEFADLLPNNAQTIIATAFVADTRWLLRELRGKYGNESITIHLVLDSNQNSMSAYSRTKSYKVNISCPPLGDNQNMHAKLILFDCKDYLRLIVTSANLQKLDYGMIRNVVYVADVPCVPTKTGITVWETSLCNFLLHLKVEEKIQLNRFDFSKLRSVPVLSIPGLYSKESLGMLGLRDTIRNHIGVLSTVQVFAQGSSISISSQKFHNEFSNCCQGRDPNTPSPATVQYVYPTQAFVEKKLRDGTWTDGQVNVLTTGNNVVRPHTMECNSVLHSKIIWAVPTHDCVSYSISPGTFSENPVGYIYLGSHNPTAQAWGKFQFENEWKLSLRNFEFGIVQPMYQAGSGFPAVRLPFTIGTEYGDTDLPFRYDHWLKVRPSLKGTKPKRSAVHHESDDEYTPDVDRPVPSERTTRSQAKRLLLPGSNLNEKVKATKPKRNKSGIPTSDTTVIRKRKHVEEQSSSIKIHRDPSHASIPSPDSPSSPDICAICMEPLKDWLNCCPNKHAFHSICFENWKKQKRNCPMCRTQYTAGNATQPESNRDNVPRNEDMIMMEDDPTDESRVSTMSSTESTQRLMPMERYDSSASLQHWRDDTFRNFMDLIATGCSVENARIQLRMEPPPRPPPVVFSELIKLVSGPVQMENVYLLFRYLFYYPSLVSSVDDYRCTMLHYACGHGNLACTVLLLAFSSDICLEDFQSNTPLHRACEFGHLEIVRWIPVWEWTRVMSQYGISIRQRCLQNGHTRVADLIDCRNREIGIELSINFAL